MNEGFDEFRRVYEVADCRTQKELAQILGIRQSSISDAKRRRSIPAEWLVTLLRIRRVNPDWILTGAGPRFLIPSEEEKGLLQSVKEFLKTYSSKELADELVRRAS